MRIRHYIWLFVLPALWVGCEEPVDLDIIPDREKLVVISNFSDIDTLEVVVSKTISVLSQEPASYLSDAIVEVFEGQKVVDRLEFVPSDNPQIPSFYRSRFLIPQRGVTYTIKVEAPGFDPVMAFNYIPEQSIGIDTNSVSFDLNQVDQDVFRTLATFDISIAIQDPPDQQNFYHLNFYQEAFNYKVILPSNDTIKERFFSLPLIIEAQNEAIPLTPYLDGRGVLLRDETFNGQTVQLDFQGSFFYDRNTQLLGDFYIELRSTSEEYYEYHTSLARQFQSGSDPLSDPVILYSNVDNGFGVFAGFASEFYVIDLTLTP